MEKEFKRVEMETSFVLNSEYVDEVIELLNTILVTILEPVYGLRHRYPNHVNISLG